MMVFPAGAVEETGCAGRGARAVAVVDNISCSTGSKVSRLSQDLSFKTYRKTQENTLSSEDQTSDCRVVDGGKNAMEVRVQTDLVSAVVN